MIAIAGGESPGFQNDDDSVTSRVRWMKVMSPGFLMIACELMHAVIACRGRCLCCSPESSFITSPPRSSPGYFMTNRPKSYVAISPEALARVPVVLMQQVHHMRRGASNRQWQTRWLRVHRTVSCRRPQFRRWSTTRRCSPVQHGAYSKLRETPTTR